MLSCPLTGSCIIHRYGKYQLVNSSSLNNGLKLFCDVSTLMVMLHELRPAIHPSSCFAKNEQSDENGRNVSNFSPFNADTN